MTSSSASSEAAVATSELSARMLFEALQRLERELDLDAPVWRHSDFHLWPMYKLEIYRLLFRLQAGSSASAAASLASRLRPAFRHADSLPVAAPGGFWLVSDGVSFTRWNGRALERFCGPLWRECQALGLAATILDRESAQPRDSSEPISWLGPWTARAKLAGIARAALLPDARHAVLVESIRQAAGRVGVTLPALSPRRFDSMARAVEALARRLGRALRRQRPRAVYIVSFYDVAGFAHVLAASRAGIPSVDVQHGVTGPFHPGYVGWDAIPAAAARLLPTWFWTWTDSDRRLIETWAPRFGRRVVCGGHPLMEAFVSGAIRPEPALRSRLDALVARAQGRTVVLVTLQPGLTTAQHLAPWLEACRRAKGVQWWVRLHPMALTDRDAVAALVAQSGAPHWEIDDATDLPLPMLLAAAAVHATHSSSTVVEATALSIPSIVWSRYGAEHFEGRVDEATFAEVSSGTGFLDRIEQWRAVRDVQLRDHPPQLVRAALQLISSAST